jgi:oligopeptide/dipeptide ABC transporter ATP-binding protein
MSSLLELDGVEVTYRQAGRHVYAVRGVSFSVDEGETVAVVGESGCGKSSTGRVVAGLRRPTAGTVRLDGEDISGHATRDVQMVFQHPDQSLDPRWTVEKSVCEPLDRARRGDRQFRREAVASALQRVGLNADYLQRRPHELSGGQAQRVAIARALVAEPRLLVLDEPTASLDQSLRGQLLATLRSLQQERGLAYLFITHDLASVRRLAHRVVVMYLGSVVEDGPVDTILNEPAHPYTKALLRAAPTFERRDKGAWHPLPGETPSATVIPPGCPFANRCPDVTSECRTRVPQLTPVGRQKVACMVATGEVAPRAVEQTTA